MTPKQFQAFLTRDKACYHCGSNGDDLVPQHRKNRKMGGSRSLKNDSNNIIVLCAEANGRLESDADFARIGLEFGWKLNSWDDLANPVYEAHTGLWWHLDGVSRVALPPEPN
jgi:hypothetical protein